MRPVPRLPGACATLGCLFLIGCGYTAKPGLPSYLRTVYVKPFVNKIDLTAIPSNEQRLPIYRHAMELDLTRRVLQRYQFTGLLRPASSEQADATLEGELIDYRRDALRYDATGQVEEWRLSLVVNLRFTDRRTHTLMWEEGRFTGDTTYFAVGAKTETEAAALDRATTDMARRIVERSIDNW